MTRERFLQLCSVDQEAMQKLAVIDENLLRLELDFMHCICDIADSADLDRRIVLKSALLLMDDLWGEMIMAL